MTVNPLPGPRGSASFDEFYRHYFPRVLMLLARYFPGCDAEDVAQETLTRCYTSYATLDPARDAWPWVSSVARNAAIDSMRRNARTVPTDELPEPPGGPVDVTYDAVLVRERRQSVRLALSRLRPSDRQLIVDHELAGFDYAAMAAVRDISTNALRQQLFRARNRLASELRRLNTTLGGLPAAIHARCARLARRLDDVSTAAGPAGATALGIAAVSGVATVATMLAGPATPVPVALPRPHQGTEAHIGAGRAAAAGPAPAPRPAVGPAAPRGPARHPAPPPASPDPTPLVIIDNDGDPIGKPDEPSRVWIRVPMPGGGEFVIKGENGHTPGSAHLCRLGVRKCSPPPPEASPSPAP